MVVKTKMMTLADDRELTYDTYGDPDGLPVIFSHGLSDSRLIRNPDDGLTASLGVWMIAADQPGVGGSSPHPGRRMVDWGCTMGELADRLGLDTFAVAGHSGGGPHTLSIAAHMPDRVTHGVLASPVGPLDEATFAKMLVMKELKLVVRLHRFGKIIRFAYRAEAKKAKKDIRAFVEDTAKGDRSDANTLLADPARRRMFEQSFTEGFAQDEEGLYEMTMALWAWGFALEDVPQHFDVFLGDADDIISPQMPERVASRLPDATTHVWPGAGHYGFVDRDHWVDFLGALTSTGGRRRLQ